MGEREIVPVASDTVTTTQNDSCIKMGNDESHFNVSLTVRDKVTRQCPQTTIFEEKGDPKRIRTDSVSVVRLTAARPNRLTTQRHYTTLAVVSLARQAAEWRSGSVLGP